jgi:hypothetical protein
VTCTNGKELVLTERLTGTLGAASLRSTSNNNSRFNFNLAKAGPLAEDPMGYHVVAIEGVYVHVALQSKRHPDGTVDVGVTLEGAEHAKTIAAALKIDVNPRKDPGHRLQATWRPAKEAFKPDEPIMLKMQLKNVGDVPVRFMVGGQQRGPRDNQYRFLAQAGYGSGKGVADVGDPLNFGGIGYYKLLKPGEVFESEVDISKWFKFTEADHYLITGMFEMEMLDPGEENYGPTIWDDLVVGECLIHVEK